VAVPGLAGFVGATAGATAGVTAGSAVEATAGANEGATAGAGAGIGAWAMVCSGAGGITGTGSSMDGGTTREAETKGAGADAGTLTDSGESGNS
jgi:hypothetical protein